MRGRRKSVLHLRPLHCPSSLLTPMTQLLTPTPFQSNVHTLNVHGWHSQTVWLNWHDRIWHQGCGWACGVWKCVWWDGERKERGFMILVLRNVMCWRSCETALALWITFRKAITTWPGSSWVMCQGKRLVSVDSTLSNLYTTITPQPPGNRTPLLLSLKGSVHTGKDMLTWLTKE